MTPRPSRMLSAEDERFAREVRHIAATLPPFEEEPAGREAEDAQARAALKEIARQGLACEVVPAAYRNPGLDTAYSVRRICIVRDELAYHSGMADVMFVIQGLGSCAITLEGGETLSSRYLPGVGRGELIAGFAVTEPDSGSDVGSITTSARRDGDHYILDGEKTYISNAGLADFYTVLARTGDEASGRDGLSMFVVEAGTPGLSVTERLPVNVPHPVGTLAFSDCRVPVSQRLGQEGGGFDLAMTVLERYRPTVGAAATGFARRALDESVGRASSRRQFGRPIAQFQAIRFKLADMAVRLDAARLLVMRAADLVDSGGPDKGPASSMAKLYASEAAHWIVDQAVQIHGGLGVTRGHIVERLYREVRSLRIYEGTSEIQRLIIARALLAGDGSAQ